MELNNWDGQTYGSYQCSTSTDLMSQQLSSNNTLNCNNYNAMHCMESCSLRGENDIHGYEEKVQDTNTMIQYGVQSHGHTNQQAAGHRVNNNLTSFQIPTPNTTYSPFPFIGNSNSYDCMANAFFAKRFKLKTYLQRKAVSRPWIANASVKDNNHISGYNGTISSEDFKWVSFIYFFNFSNYVDIRLLF